MGYWKPGQQIQRGRYIIDKILGSGGAGVTYRAQDQLSSQVVAIKTLNALIQARPDFSKHQERFIQEAFRLAKCNHPHIIQVGDVFQEEDLWCMVMEYINGGTLRQYLDYKKELSEEEALGYIRQIGAALGYIHQQGFLHRDVKPGNIMLRKKTLEAILIDFGLARDFVQDKWQEHTNSRTESFAPIEQYEIHAKRGAYTDVYALAATLYYIITLQLPFPSHFRQQGANLIAPKYHNPQISNSLNNAILKGMEILPENRPQSVQEWLSLLTPSFVSQSVIGYKTPKIDNEVETRAKETKQTVLIPSVSEKTSERRSSRLLSKYSLRQNKEAMANSSVSEMSTLSALEYSTLEQFLKISNWQAADQETAKIMLKVTQREKEGWLDPIHIDNFPCDTLRFIDELWLKASGKRFGFSTQKQIYEKLGGKLEHDAEIWRKFGEQVGWRKNNTWLPYKDLNFNLWAQPGHLPMMGMQLWGFTGWFVVVSKRLTVCSLI